MISFSQRSLWLVGVVALAGMALAGCGDDDMPGADGGVRDGGRDAGRDAAMLDSSMGDGDGGSGTCGDGEIGGDEECDDGAANSDTEADACRTDCTLAGCGDDVTDSDETCDGDDLGGRTCVDEEFVSGVLGCATDCAAYDTTMCSEEPGPVCGDDTVEGTEECDGVNIAGRTCNDEMPGTVGSVTCTAACTFDATACTRCGNGVIDAGEACDGTELGTAMCPAGGTLACTASCALDMSGCTGSMTCGNDTAEGTEACDGTDLRGATCLSRGFTGGTLSCAACVYVESACTSPPVPTTAGQIVITEVMRDPAAYGADPNGEFFEVHNPGTTDLQLQSCVVDEADGAPSFPITTSVIVPAGGYATFAATSTVIGAPGFTPSFSYPASFSLNNSGTDSLRITCGTVEIDTLVWSAAFPAAAGTSMQLNPTSLTATANDVATNWCLSTSTFGSAATPDLGTPGAANSACVAPAVWPVSFCRLQFPATITADIGVSTTVYGRVYAAGLTDMTTGNDVSTSLIAALGYGPDGSDPAAAASGWTWITAMPNAGWSDGADVNNDEYQAALVAPAPAGAYDYAYRFSGDSGATWLYCDTSGSSPTDAYAPASAGAMTTTATTVTANLFFSEYIEGSSNNKVVEIYNAGTTSVDLTACAIRLYSNGSTTVTNMVALTGSLAAADTFVACHGSTAGAATLCDLAVPGGGAVGFNGDDAIDLVCSGTVLDTIGQIGSDPGTEWIGSGVSTLNMTLRRQCTVTVGDRVGSDAFDPSVQWTAFPIDTFDGLGVRSCPTMP